MKIEYNGESLSIAAIARKEGLNYQTLRNAYSETKSIREAVILARKKREARQGNIKYKGKTMTIEAIANMEGLSSASLRKAYRELQDIEEAVRITKERKEARVYIDYRGKLKTITAIAKQEGLSDTPLRKAFEETRDIDAAIELAKQRQATKTRHIEYKGEMLTISAIAKREGLTSNSLRRNYNKTRDIYEAVRITQESQVESQGTIEHNGRKKTISAIAMEEGVESKSLRNLYNKTQDISEAIRIAKERQARIIYVEYNGKNMTINAIAKKEGIVPNSLRKEYLRTGNINKAILICQSRKIKINRHRKVNTQYGQISLQDLTLILGIKYNELESLLAKGLTIEQIQNMKLKTSRRAGVQRERVELPNGQNLRDYCAQNGLNYACIYRSIYTFGKTLEEAVQHHKEHGQGIPESWIFEKYGVLLKHIMLSDKIDIYRVIDYMREDLSPIDEAVEKYLIRRNAREVGIDIDWAEEIYGVLTDANTGREYDDWIKKFYINEEEEECVIKSFEEAEKFRRKLDLFEIREVLIDETFTPEEERDLLRQYDVTSDEIDLMFLDLYGKFDRGILRGENQEVQQRTDQLNDVIRKWQSCDEKERVEISKKYRLTSEELQKVETESAVIRFFKELIDDEVFHNQDEDIVKIMRNSVKENVETNSQIRAEFRRIMRQHTISR